MCQRVNILNIGKNIKILILSVLVQQEWIFLAIREIVAVSEDASLVLELQEHIPCTCLGQVAQCISITSAVSYNLDICCRRPFNAYMYKASRMHEPSRKHMHMHSGHGQWVWLRWPTEPIALSLACAWTRGNKLGEHWYYNVSVNFLIGYSSYW